MLFAGDHRTSASETVSLFQECAKRMTLHTRSQKDGKGDFSSVRFLSQVNEFTDCGVEHNVQLPAPPKEAERRREAILTIS